MIKKLSMIVLGVIVFGFCMAIVPQEKVEAADITVSGSHKHCKKSGLAEGCYDDKGRGSNNSKTFMTNSRGSYQTKIDWLTAKRYYKVIVSSSGCCKASKSKRVYVAQSTSTGLSY